MSRFEPLDRFVFPELLRSQKDVLDLASFYAFKGIALRSGG